MEQAYGCYGVTPVVASVLDLISGTIKFTDLDLIYSAGLFDYLDDRLALRLIETRLSSLKPDGRLFIANFMPDYKHIGFMEAIMEWTRVSRNEEQLLAIINTAGGKPLRASHALGHERLDIICALLNSTCLPFTPSVPLQTS